MPSDCITYQNSGYFSKLIVDYLDQKENLKPLYNRFPTIENFKLQIAEKEQNFPVSNRTILADALQKQYANFKISDATQANVEALKSENTFTITTGHQLNLFTGPLYFLYKIISVINLCKDLKKQYPNYHFVPVYWMATEDHDFEEINYFNFKSKKIHWEKDAKGPVGRFDTKGLQEVFDVFSLDLGLGENANYLRNLFEKAYTQHKNLANATRYLANELFKEDGLVIIDGDDSSLKRIFSPYVKDELEQQSSFTQVEKTIPLLKDYNVQVNPREINLFYIQDNLRERIVFENGHYLINNTQLSFSKSEILTELENYPERFSPNVILRPLYQEVILPNLCYIGGGGELAYWLELKSNFEHQNVTFPILLLRNSAVIATEKQNQKIAKLNLNWNDLFLKQEVLKNKEIQSLSQFTIDFTPQKEHLKKQFEALYQIANQTDQSFVGAVAAQEKKQLKGLENLEKRLLKAEKRIHQEKLSQIVALQNQLFPGQSLQERKLNFSEIVLEFGITTVLNTLKARFNPLSNEFNVVIL